MLVLLKFDRSFIITLTCDFQFSCILTLPNYHESQQLIRLYKRFTAQHVCTATSVLSQVKECIVLLSEIHLRTTGRHLSMGSHSVVCHPTELTARLHPNHGGKNPGGRTLLFSVDNSRGGATFAKWATATLKHGG